MQKNIVQAFTILSYPLCYSTDLRPSEACYKVIEIRYAERLLLYTKCF